MKLIPLLVCVGAFAQQKDTPVKISNYDSIDFNWEKEMFRQWDCLCPVLTPEVVQQCLVRLALINGSTKISPSSSTAAPTSNELKPSRSLKNVPTCQLAPQCAGFNARDKEKPVAI
jgi:hypothetical protein